MLIQTIVDEFNTYFEQAPEHDTILWFDPQREWEGLLPCLQPVSYTHLTLPTSDLV